MARGTARPQGDFFDRLGHEDEIEHALASPFQRVIDKKDRVSY